MKRLILSLLLGMGAVAPASALSCMAPDPVKDLVDRLKDGQDITLGYGTGKSVMRFASPAPDPNHDGVIERNGRPETGIASFSGEVFGTGGSVTVHNMLVQTHSSCVAHWCGSLPFAHSQPDEDYLVFFSAKDDAEETSYSVHQGACGGDVYHSITEDQLTQMREILSEET